MTEVPEHLLRRSKERRAALGLTTGDDAAPAPAPAATAAVAESSGGAAPPATTAATPAAPAAPAAPPPSVGVPTRSLRDPSRTRTRVPVWAMPVLVLLPFWAVLYAGGFGERESHAAEGASATASSGEGGEGAGAPPSGSAVVELANNEFSPTSIDVKVGDTVVWEWAADELHNVTGPGFKSPNQSSGEYTHTFEKAGTFKYVCTLHPNMKAEVVVA